jgi:hypothetical protein
MESASSEPNPLLPYPTTVKYPLDAITLSAKKVVVIPPMSAGVPQEVPGRTVGVTLLLAPDALEVPTAFVAVTVNVYGVPVVKPVTVIGELEPVAVMPPGEDVTV